MTQIGNDLVWSLFLALGEKKSFSEIAILVTVKDSVWSVID